ncbi:MAG: cytochrome c biogenesis protein DipZ [Parachlamydiaceae bacterium]|nr:cytochrome c biogenesis protein DipZ [Parachlamydiaceae bacterium]
MVILFLFAMLAGIATVISPCILPILPAILSASATGGRQRPLGVIFGLLTSFVFFTLTLTTLVQTLGISANYLRYFAIFIIALFGLILLIPSWSDRFASMTNFLGQWGEKINTNLRQKKQSGFFSGIIIGIALGLVWTPCAGPILAAITTLVATQQITYQTILLTIAYSIGAGIPLILIAYGSQSVFKAIPYLKKHSERIRQIFGLLMILTSLALIFNWDIIFQQKVLDFLPNFQVQNQYINEKLDELKDHSQPSLLPEKKALKLGDKAKKRGNELPIIAKAPDLVGINAWINSAPLTLENLKGKVVLIDFWTYSCINCIRTFPYLRDWYEKYQNKGFVIIGVHTPEFEFEKDEANVKAAVKRFELKYPVAMDNQYKTWQAYANSYWPAHYLIDQNGMVRQVHFGEGKYLETENAIRSLLDLPALSKESLGQEKSQKDVKITPETYLGYLRASSYSPDIKIVKDKTEKYSFQGNLELNQVALKGSWNIGPEKITSESDSSQLSLNFQANRVYLVMGGKSIWPVKVFIDDQPISPQYRTEDMDDFGSIKINEPRKYDIINLQGKDGEHSLTLHIPKGIEVYAFTFGMEN